MSKTIYFANEKKKKTNFIARRSVVCFVGLKQEVKMKVINNTKHDLFLFIGCLQQQQQQTQTQQQWQTNTPFKAKEIKKKNLNFKFLCILLGVILFILFL